MAWYDEAVFYHIYPLGLTGAPATNTYGEVEHRLNTLLPWIDHIKDIGCNAIYIGPLFESVGHGYETTDYKRLDSRLGDNKDLTNFVNECHKAGIRVILDGVFNHTGRDFFAFKDIQQNRENSQYKDWYCNVNFWGNTEYNDGFSYENWGGYNLLVKLNQHNPAVRDYICDVIRFWVSEFDIDGIRLDAADVLDFNYMQALRQVANEVKPDFWLMGEVIHGDYIRWVNEGTLHSVTNYHLHKALYSGHNDHNFFEIAHTVKRLYEMGGNRPDGLKLYNFVDNHDVERIHTKLNNKAHFTPVHILEYTLPGVPSIYYGSEFGIDGHKEKYSDASLRPQLNLTDYQNSTQDNPFTRLISQLGHIRQACKPLSYGDYKELLLMNRQYAFSRNYNGDSVIVTVNNDDSDYTMTLPAGNVSEYYGALSGERITVNNGCICVNIKANSGDIWIPCNIDISAVTTSSITSNEATESVLSATDSDCTIDNTVSSDSNDIIDTPTSSNSDVAVDTLTSSDSDDAIDSLSSSNLSETTSSDNISATQDNKENPPQENNVQPEQATTNQDIFDREQLAYEKGKIAGLQEAILAIMEKNGPVTDQMRKDVMDNVYHDSLITWVKSFR